LVYQQTFVLTGYYNPNDPYIINPKNAQGLSNVYSTYAAGVNDSGDSYAQLPDPSLYDGLELKFFGLRVINVSQPYSIILSISSSLNDKYILYKIKDANGDEWYTGTRKIRIETGVAVIKSIYGQWFVVSGNVTDVSQQN